MINEVMNMLNEYDTLHWFCDACNVTATEAIQAFSPTETTHSLTNAINSVVHKTLDKVMGDLKKVLNDTTNQLQQSLGQAAQLTYVDHMDVSRRDRPPSRSPPSDLLQHHSVVDVFDE